MDAEITTLLQECDTLKARLSAIRPLPVEALKKIEDALAIEYTYERKKYMPSCCMASIGITLAATALCL